MADAGLVIGSLAFNPDKVNDYLRSSYNDKYQQFLAGWFGAVVINPASEEVLPGTEVKAPRMSMVKAAEKLDVTNTSSKDSTAYGGGAAVRGPVCSNVVFPVEYFDHAMRVMKRNNTSFEAELGAMMAQRLVNAKKLDVLYALRGAIGSTSTVSHVNDDSGLTVKTAQAGDIFDTANLLGDSASELKVAVMHSKVKLSLIKSLATSGNWNAPVAGDDAMRQAVVKIGNLIIVECDDGTKVAGASAGLDAYYTFLLGEGAVELFPATNSPLFTAVINVDKGARATKLACEDHYGLVIPGMGMTTDATGNPAAAELYDTGNWSEAFSHDHRDFRAAYLKTLNG